MSDQNRYIDEVAQLRGFAAPLLGGGQADALAHIARGCRRDAVMMTSIANSGHPAGALSSMDIYVTLLAAADITPKNCDDASRDRIVVSHGHTSAGVYASLAAFGFFDRAEAIANFRRAGSPYQGHIEREVPGVEWGTGNLGQGLAAGVGFAIAAKACGRSSRTFVVMGDGEQPKGENAEARRLAQKFGLSNITAIIDANDIQISGHVGDVMPCDIRRIWEADGWSVAECDGHDFAALYSALRAAVSSDAPTVIIAHTVMGKGVSFMEGIPEYHGKAATGEKLEIAMRELGGDMDEIAKMRALRGGPLPRGREVRNASVSLDVGSPKTYTTADKKDGRGAFGAALADIAKRDPNAPLIAFDCDLAGSVKLDVFAAVAPERFYQAGIQEHAVATAAGAASTAGAAVVWADFGVFGTDEVYNQQRLNDINHASLKTVITHVGLDVGEDGMTHQCIDHVALFRNLFGSKIVVPADPNQVDRAVRWMMREPGPVCLAVGRGVHPVIMREDDPNAPFFGGDEPFVYGAIDILREGDDAVILAMGHLAVAAIEAREILKGRGVSAKVLHCASPLAMDGAKLIELVGSRPLITVEDHCASSGIGASAAMIFARAGAPVKLRTLGVTRYGDSGSAAEVTSRMGLGANEIASAVEASL